MRQRRESSRTYLAHTLSTCAECMKLVKTKVYAEAGRVYFSKRCPEHGHSAALASEDVDHYLGAKRHARPGSIPHRFSTEVRAGCPEDCGLCPDHEQHTCHPIVEVTDRCNLSCPMCIAGQRREGEMSPADLSLIVDRLIESEGTLDNLTLSGGEPTLHSDLRGLLKAASRDQIKRVSIVTNGVRLAEDDELCRMLSDLGVYVLLQFDGFDDEAYLKLRGARLLSSKERALEKIERFGLSCQLIFMAARGVNEHLIGDALNLMLRSENIISMAVQPMAFAGPASAMGFDPMDRLTVPGTIKAIAAQSGGLLRQSDFIPLPCPNPECVSMTYLLKLDGGGFVPFPRFVDMDRYLYMFADTAVLENDMRTERAMHEIITDLWSTAGEVTDSERITGALRRAIDAMNCKDGSCGGDSSNRLSERQAKSIFIHHYMDRYNFDLARVIKCCHHYPRPDGRIMPICAFNHFHRQKEEHPYASKG